MRDTDADMDCGSVQEAARSTDVDAMSTRRYTVGPDEPLDVAIVYAIAATKGVSPTELDQPLNDAVDADALRRLFEGADESLSATLRFEELEVTVADGGNDVIVSSK